jgi:hypothetical protein
MSRFGIAPPEWSKGNPALDPPVQQPFNQQLAEHINGQGTQSPIYKSTEGFVDCGVTFGSQIVFLGGTGSYRVYTSRANAGPLAIDCTDPVQVLHGIVQTKTAVAEVGVLNLPTITAFEDFFGNFLPQNANNINIATLSSPRALFYELKAKGLGGLSLSCPLDARYAGDPVSTSGYRFFTPGGGAVVTGAGPFVCRVAGVANASSEVTIDLSFWRSTANGKLYCDIVV